jgi:hypothetical protein
MFSYVKREIRDRDKKEIRETEKIKIKIHQLQTVVIFDRKFRLKHATRPQKSYDEIYMINDNFHL